MEIILKKIKISLSVGFVGLVLLLGCGCASIVNSNCYNVAVYSNTPTTCTVITKSTKEKPFTEPLPKERFFKNNIMLGIDFCGNIHYN